MKIKYLPLLLASIFCSSSFAETDDKDTPLLRGILNLGDTQAFSLYDPGQNQSSWLKIGESFLGYTLGSFDPETESLTLQSGTETLVLQLAAASEGALPGETGSLEERMAEATRLMETMQFQEMMEKSLEAQIAGTGKLLREQMKRFSPNGEVDEEFLEFQTKAIGEMFEDFDWKPVESAMTEAYADVFTADELKQISAFYTTSAGKSYIENNPEIQAKTSQAMMPAMIEASTKLQIKLASYMQNRTEQVEDGSETAP